MDNRHQFFFAPCPRGLEGVLCAELERLGAQNVVASQGGVGFSGAFDLCYTVNLESRIASRVLWKIFQGRYDNEQDLYQAAFMLPWYDWFSVRRTIKVKVSAQRCALRSLDFATLRIKDAVCDKFTAAIDRQPSVDTQQPDIRIAAFLDQKAFTFYLDTSGEALFKRGLRKRSTQAPLRENLAAGILLLSGWSREQVLLDPMCGGGTILMEAAQMARKIAPGLGRTFAFEKLNNFDEKVWERLCEASRSHQTARTPIMIYGSDREAKVLKTAQTNLEKAGLADAVSLQQTDVFNCQPPSEQGVLVTNPPYGVRLDEQANLATFYLSPSW